MKSIRIAGAGKIIGGEYDEIKVSGSATIEGEIKCNLFKSAGTMKCDSSISSKEFKASGSAKIEGNLKVDTGKVSGAIRIEGSLEGSKFEVAGSIVVTDDVNVDEFTAKISNGSFKNIYGDNVKINSDGSFLNNFFHEVVKNITVDSIEATNICIKDVNAESISGEVVCIESGCKVKIVEYSKSLDISSKATVERIIKL